jgi:hypothetical protein
LRCIDQPLARQRANLQPILFAEPRKL